MDDSRIRSESPTGEKGCVFDLDSLMAEFETLRDRRKDQGRRYTLTLVLLLLVLAKLCGENRPYGIAEWIRERQAVLVGMLGLSYAGLPSHNTYRRVLRDVVGLEELQGAVRRFLSRIYEPDDSWLVSVDGKTLRGSVPKGQKQAVHLLAAYVPQAGVVLLQVVVDGKENEITAAPRLLQSWICAARWPWGMLC